MLAIVRIALQGVLFFMLLGIVVAIGDGDVGLLEKLVAAAFGALLVWVAVRVRGLGRPPTASGHREGVKTGHLGGPGRDPRERWNGSTQFASHGGTP